MRSEQAALEAAHQIEDIFCQHHAGGRVQRLARIQIAICDAIARSRSADPEPSARRKAPSSHLKFPQPAIPTSVQSEAEVDQGEDQRAQKEVAVAAGASAGAAEEAGNSSADPRNSSRPAGEVASALLPVDRTDDQPSPSIEPIGPAERTRKDRILDLWHETEMTREEIAERVGVKQSSVTAYLSLARRVKDRRAKRLCDRTEAKKVIERDVIRSVVAPAESAPVDPKPAAKIPSVPLDPRPGRIVGVTIDSPGSVVSLDMENFVVACPEGDWQVARPVALIMERLRNGEMYDPKVLADTGSMAVDTLLAALPRWTADLASRGVELVTVKGIGCRLRRAGA